MPKTETECSNCGCRDLAKVSSYMGQDTYQCNHCATEVVEGFGPYEEISTDYQTTVCPVCKSTNQKITRGPQEQKDGRFKRFHKCGDCRNPFASYEVREASKV